MLAKITAPDLPQDCNEAELLLERHKEYNTEIEGRLPVFHHFYETGYAFIKEGHALSQEIEDKIKILQQKIDLLDNTWRKRNLIYQQNLDLQLFKREAATLENWMVVREGVLKDGKVGDTISQVEEFIRKHRDFEETIKAQEDRFNSLRRQTLLEEAFTNQKMQEALAMKAEKERLEQERLEQRKLIEKARYTELRRQESKDSPR